MTRRLRSLTLCVLACLALTSGCSSYRKSGGAAGTDESLRTDADLALKQFIENDPTLKKFMEGAHGYAIFPEVVKGAAGIGAAHGEGIVYEQGRWVGMAELSQVTLGAQLGGQSYSELIFFQDATVLNAFKAGDVEFSAQASAVASASGAAANADYKQGVAIFVMGQSGLMFEASIGGQGFRYRPRETPATPATP